MQLKLTHLLPFANDTCNTFINMLYYALANEFTVAVETLNMDSTVISLPLHNTTHYTSPSTCIYRK